MTTREPQTDPMAEALRYAEAWGRQDGHAAGSWVVDGNTTEAEARAIVDAFTDGTYWELSDYGPLSGQYADDVTPRDLFETCTGYDYTADADDDGLTALCDAYETGWHEAYEAEAVGSARYVIDGTP